MLKDQLEGLMPMMFCWYEYQLHLDSLVCFYFYVQLMKHYTFPNLSEGAQAFTAGFFQLISSLAETFVYVIRPLNSIVLNSRFGNILEFVDESKHLTFEEPTNYTRVPTLRCNSLNILQVYLHGNGYCNQIAQLVSCWFHFLFNRVHCNRKV